MKTITIPSPCFVMLIGPSGAGKSTFARKHFKETEIVSSDHYRAVVSDDQNNQSASTDAFELVHLVASKRLARYRTVVMDATNVKSADRIQALNHAKKHDLPCVAIVLDIPPQVCFERNKARPERNFDGSYVFRHSSNLRSGLNNLRKEGFRAVHHLRSVDEINDVEIRRKPLPCDKRHEEGPFDIIGDIHGCYDELVALLEKLGYVLDNNIPQHPNGRKLIFLGDLADRGPKSPDVFRLVMNAVFTGTAYCTLGNHDEKLGRKLRGKDVKITHGLDLTLQQLKGQSELFLEAIRGFIESLDDHYVFDRGNLVVSHAGLTEELQGRSSGVVHNFCLRGDTTGEVDEFGLPIRHDWAAKYNGKALVAYGHVATTEALFFNNTICLDTGCVYGGKLSALRYPEREIIQVTAEKAYYESKRPLQERKVEDSSFTLLDIQDVFDRKRIDTRLIGSVNINENQLAAALENVSRFAVDPRWLIYVPPTMSPCDTNDANPDFLEHPQEAFDYFKKCGVQEVICEQKHMGSRAIVIICKDEATAKKRFHTTDGRSGIIYTRTGRLFFNDAAVENELLNSMRMALEAEKIWDYLQTDWICLDTEIMPWSAKAKGLLQDVYAPTGVAATQSLKAAHKLLEMASGRYEESKKLLQLTKERLDAANLYEKAYHKYCWQVKSADDLVVAPFHILATGNYVWDKQDHLTHLLMVERLTKSSHKNPFIKTPYYHVSFHRHSDIDNAILRWKQDTENGIEGYVIKPRNWIERTSTGLVQPAIKVRGREYLRIIYGLEYTLPDQLKRLRKRNTAKKRNLAIKEYALGLEGLHRFVENEPLSRVHECAMGVLALEEDRTDPRL